MWTEVPQALDEAVVGVAVVGVSVVGVEVVAVVADAQVLRQCAPPDGGAMNAKLRTLRATTILLMPP